MSNGLLLSHWYSGSGVVLDCIDSWSLPSFLLCLDWRVAGSFWQVEKKKQLHHSQYKEIQISKRFSLFKQTAVTRVLELFSVWLQLLIFLNVFVWIYLRMVLVGFDGLHPHQYLWSWALSSLLNAVPTTSIPQKQSSRSSIATTERFCYYQLHRSAFCNCFCQQLLLVWLLLRLRICYSAVGVVFLILSVTFLAYSNKHGMKNYLLCESKPVLKELKY